MTGDTAGGGWQVGNQKQVLGAGGRRPARWWRVPASLSQFLLQPQKACQPSKGILFLHERRGNVYENKGPLWKSTSEAGMFMKVKVVIRSTPECI
jgi:hypothetical protein